MHEIELRLETILAPLIAPLGRHRLKIWIEHVRLRLIRFRIWAGRKAFRIWIGVW